MRVPGQGAKPWRVYVFDTCSGEVLISKRIRFEDRLVHDPRGERRLPNRDRPGARGTTALCDVVGDRRIVGHHIHEALLYDVFSLGRLARRPIKERGHATLMLESAIPAVSLRSASRPDDVALV